MTRGLRLRDFLFLFAVLLLVPLRTPAQTPPPGHEDELRRAQQAALAAQIVGPSEVRLADQAILGLPAGYAFIPGPEARAWMRLVGGNPGESTLGIVIAGADRPDDWFVVVRFIPAGYVRDDDAKDWNADKLLESLREGTEESNAERRRMGLREIMVAGWIEPPRYDERLRRLVWAAEVREKGVVDESPSVNFNTYALGRDGYASLNLVTGLLVVDARKRYAAELLDRLAFVPGKRYDDFNAATDRVAEFGLAGLVAGVAAKKLGLFAVVAALLAKSWKLIAVAAVMLAAPLVKLFRRRPPPSA